MGDIDNEKHGREARDVVGAQRSTAGENRVQAAMRSYLGAAAFRSRDRVERQSEKPDDKSRGRG